MPKRSPELHGLGLDTVKHACMGAPVRYDRFTHLTGCIILIFLFVISCSNISNKAYASINKCIGWGFVNPRAENDFGRIYVSFTPDDRGRFRRKGYLPRGSIIRLMSPIESSSSRFRNSHCGFDYRSVVFGHIDRNGVTSLSDLLNEMDIKESSVFGVASPANPEPNSLMNIFKTPTDVQPNLQLGRNNRDPVFILKQENGALFYKDNFLRVHYIDRNSTSGQKELRVGYIDVAAERIDSSDGTYRIFEIFPHVQKEEASESQQENHWYYKFLRNVNSFLNNPDEQVNIYLRQGETQIQELSVLASCKRTGKVTLKLEASGGLKTPYFGLSASGEGEYTWEIKSNEAVQLTSISDDNSLNINISAIAKCKQRSTDYLEEVIFTVESPKRNRIEFFPVKRDQFYKTVSNNNNAIIERLKSESIGQISINPIYPLLIVPLSNGEANFYYDLFNSIERYMRQDVYEWKTIPPEDQFAVILVFVDTLTQWRGSKGSRPRR